MISREEAAALLAAIKANSAKLAGCAGPHGFQPFKGKTCYGAENGQPGIRFVRCIRCQGELNELEAAWYRRGLAHGRNETDPSAVRVDFLQAGDVPVKIDLVRSAVQLLEDHGCFETASMLAKALPKS